MHPSDSVIQYFVDGSISRVSLSPLYYRSRGYCFDVPFEPDYHSEAVRSACFELKLIAHVSFESRCLLFPYAPLKSVLNYLFPVHFSPLTQTCFMSILFIFNQWDIFSVPFTFFCQLFIPIRIMHFGFSDFSYHEPKSQSVRWVTPFMLPSQFHLTLSWHTLLIRLRKF